MATADGEAGLGSLGSSEVPMSGQVRVGVYGFQDRESFRIAYSGRSLVLEVFWRGGGMFYHGLLGWAVFALLDVSYMAVLIG